MPSDSQWVFGPFRLDTTNMCLWHGCDTVALKPKTFMVLQYLVAHAGQLVTKAALLDAVWPETAVSDGVLKVCIAELRKALATHGQGEAGIAQMHHGLAAIRATGAALRQPYYLAVLAEVYGQCGRAEDGLTLLAEALEAVRTTGEYWWEAELYRLKGELLLSLSGDHRSAAHACFQQALEIARRQQAKSLELRAAMSLGQLWQQQGKRNPARQLLGEVYGCFTEGFDTADLQAARALLAALA